MRSIRLLLFFLAIPLIPFCGSDEVADLANAVASELEGEQVEVLDEALYEGFVHGIALNFDYVSLGRQTSSESEPDEAEKEETHKHNLLKAELEADYLTRHRPLESTEVDEMESDAYSLFNIVMHYMNSRAQRWKLVEPKSEALEDGLEHHMVFVSDSSDVGGRHIPRSMILSVGNIAKTLPQKNGKTPILLTCLETFIVSKLAYTLIGKLLKSSAPVDTKLKYIDRWINLAQNHFILYLPYITITAQRCVGMLEENGELKSDFNNDHYRVLLKNCKSMAQKRDNEADLQTFVMLDSELHSTLIESCIKQRHIIPSLLEEKETHLKSIHQVLDKEMSWETFTNAVNMVFSDVERDILKADDFLMQPATWGCGLSKKDADTAEKKLIAAFAKSHVQLNLKVRSALIELNRIIAAAAPDKGASLAKALVSFVEHEHNAAVEEAKQNKELSQCIDDAKRTLTSEADKYDNLVTKASYTDGIAMEMKKYQNEGWMPCMSARILTTITETCANKTQYCKVLLEVLREAIGTLDPDSTSALIMENFHNVICVSLLKNDSITAEDLRKYLAKEARHELKEVSALSGGSSTEKPAETEGAAKNEENQNGTSEAQSEKLPSDTTEQVIKEH
ncbi:uncharacterized protein BXIN_0982 [Babesia sp. Xinjiang]|uniref:uncharacterized protein n=1 Tax=Babesia sp. Xinjiang TaxID=462227 RepID=UPI000A23D96C|nr:uncharacterized protein BXIN_0982 [Babesia sp. Xinjiang]ORM42224.1 hypothetical protein BXIN_0982 [Babesia sp. Xinjiang]